MEKPPRVASMSDGFSFQEQPDGSWTDGDMTFDSLRSMFEEDPDVLIDGLPAMLVNVDSFSFVNPQGGTGLSDWSHNERFPGQTALVEVVRGSEDYETGYRFTGFACESVLAGYLQKTAKGRQVFFSEHSISDPLEKEQAIEFIDNRRDLRAAQLVSKLTAVVEHGKRFATWGGAVKRLDEARSELRDCCHSEVKISPAPYLPLPRDPLEFAMFAAQVHRDFLEFDKDSHFEYYGSDADNYLLALIIDVCAEVGVDLRDDNGFCAQATPDEVAEYVLDRIDVAIKARQAPAPLDRPVN